jgi:hypothetical protein
VHSYRVTRKEDRPEPPEGPTLGAQALMRAIEELPIYRHLIGARVAYKRNAKGEHVVAVV